MPRNGEDVTYIVMRDTFGGSDVAGSHRRKADAEIQALRLNKRNKRVNDARWRVIAIDYFDSYEDYDALIDLRRSELVELAETWNVATSGTKHDIAKRIANIDIYD